ncbi:MAG: hypothetical protein ACD_5C00046G0001, partial [uncultured bacterium]
MKNEGFKFLKTILFFAFLFVFVNVAKADYPATLNSISVTGNTGLANTNT